MLFYVILGLSVLSSTAFAAPSDKVDCSKVDEILDDLGAAQGMTTMNDKYKLSVSADDHTKRCTEMNEAIKTLRKYNKECFTALTQQVFSAILRTRSQSVEKRCQAGTPDFTSTVEAQKCIQDNALEGVKNAERKTLLTAQAIVDANIADEKLRTRSGCCAVLAGKTFFLEATKEKCSKYEKDYVEYIDSYTSEAFGLICPDADKLECNKLDPVKVDGLAQKSQFFLNPTIKLVKTLDH